MVSYPKMFVFLGNEKLGELPGNMRSAQQIFAWFRKEYNLEPEEQIEDLWFWYQNSIDNTKLFEYKPFIFIEGKKTKC